MKNARSAMVALRDRRLSELEPDQTKISPSISVAPRRGIVLIERFGILVVWAIVAGVFSAVEPSRYLSVGNLANIFGSQAVLVIITLALTVPLTAGDYDLSVGGVVSLSSMTIAVLNSLHHWSLSVALVVALAAGALVGLINGLVMTVFAIDSLIVTLGHRPCFPVSCFRSATPRR